MQAEALPGLCQLEPKALLFPQLCHSLNSEKLLGRAGEGTPGIHMAGRESPANGIVSSTQEGTDAGQAAQLVLRGPHPRAPCE